MWKQEWCDDERKPQSTLSSKFLFPYDVHYQNKRQFKSLRAFIITRFILACMKQTQKHIKMQDSEELHKQTASCQGLLCEGASGGIREEPSCCILKQLQMCEDFTADTTTTASY